MENTYLKDLFDKQITCPVCNNIFRQKAVKVNSPRLLSKDTDFFIRYKTVNPYFYDVWICNSCGYSAMKKDFEKLREREKSLVLEKISAKWTSKIYPDILNINHAIERYKLALITANVCEKRASTLAILSIKLAWMYRLKEDKQNEIFFLEKALFCFLNAFMNDPFPIFGLQRDGLTYLIGELYNRTGNFSEALLWFSKVATNTNASYKIKELARNARYNIKDNLQNK